jgi:hypothetical protein
MLMKTLQLLFRGSIFALVCALFAMPALAGTIFVVCPGTNNIQVLSDAGATGTPIAGGSLEKPVAMAIDTSGNLYVSNDQSPYFIEKFSSTGTDLGTFATTGLNRPHGLAFDHAGNLYAANPGNNSVEKFSAAGADLGPFVSSGLSGPVGLAFDSSGDLYVVNSGANTISEFSSAGASLGTISSTNLNYPYRLAFDTAGNFYVTSYSNNSVEKFSPAGTDLGAFAAGLNGPTGLAFDNSGNLYVCNEDSPNIEEYSANGTDLGALGNVAGTSPAASDIAFFSGGQIEFSAAAYQTFEDAGTITITANRVGGSSGATSVAYTTSDSSAVAGTDYTSTNGTLSWEDGDATAKTFTVHILDRGSTNGGSVSFSVMFLRSGGTGTLGTPAAATVTINDNDGSSTGQLAFSTAAYPAFEDQGSVTITVNRTGGSSGATSVAYATSNGKAVAGTDYTAANGTLSWASGDATAKTFQIPIRDRHITSGASADFLVTLSQVAGTAALGTPAQAAVTITDNDAPIVEPTVFLQSPPAPLTVLTGTNVYLEANFTDPSNQLNTVQFLVNGHPASTQNYGDYYAGSFLPLLPGTYQVEAQATALDGTVSSDAQTVTVVNPVGVVAAPQAALLAALDGLTVAAGSNLTVTVMALSGVNGQALERVDFYADGILFSSDDGSGHPIMESAPGRQPVTQDAVPASVNTVFQATYRVPASSQPVSIMAVATTTAGISKLTAPVRVQPVAESGTQPKVTLGGLTEGERVGADSSVAASVTVSQSSSAIQKVQYYVNSRLASTSAAPPYGFTVTPRTAGEYVLTAIATDANGVATVSLPLTIKAVPTVALSIKGDGKAVVDGEVGKVLFTRKGEDLSAPLTVFFKLTGTAKDGVNYAHVGRKVVIPAGKATYKLKIKPLDTGTGPLKLKLFVKLLPAPEGTYAIGHVAKVKVTLEQTQ